MEDVVREYRLQLVPSGQYWPRRNQHGMKIVLDFVMMELVILISAIASNTKFCLNYIRHCQKLANLCHRLVTVCFHEKVIVLRISISKFLQSWPDECGGYRIQVTWHIYDSSKKFTVHAEAVVRPLWPVVSCLTGL
jgi:hypothetical protein